MRHLLLLSIIIVQSAIGQAPSIQWQNRFGGSSYDYSLSGFQTSDGGFIIGGRSGSNASVDKSQDTKGNDDYWLVKTDDSGIKVWDRDYGAAGYDDQGSGQDLFYGLLQCTDGGYLTWGWSNSPASGDKSESAFNFSQDYWIVRSNSNGIILWENTIGGNDEDTPSCAIQTSDQGFLIGGISASSISGDKDDSCRGGNDWWLVKLNANGELIWQRTIGTEMYDGISKIFETETGYLIVGTTPSGISADKSVPSFGNNDIWIAMISTNGSILWQKDYGGTGERWRV